MNNKLPTNQIICGDALDVLQTFPDESVQTCITSPPYWGLRDYGIQEQIGLEKTPEEYITKLIQIFREVKRVLRKDGTLWLNLGDCYAGSGKAGKNPEYQKRHTQFGQTERKERLGVPIPASQIGMKPKDLVGIPWRTALTLQADGWWLRSDIIWHKKNPMPESVRDRPTKSHEYLFLLTKNKSYYYDQDAIREPHSPETQPRMLRGVSAANKWAGSAPVSTAHTMSRPRANRTHKNLENKGQPIHGMHQKRADEGIEPQLNPAGRNKRTVWTVSTKPYPEAHFATFPPDLIEPCILAGSPIGGIVLDPFIGSGTTAEVALKYNRNFVGIEINPEYIKLAAKRTQGITPMMVFDRQVQ